MSYEHRGLVIGVTQKLLYVLAIFSYDSKKHTDVYHPVNLSVSKNDLILSNLFYDYEQDKKSIESLNDQIATLADDKKNLEKENEKLKAEIENLQSKLKSSINS